MQLSFKSEATADPLPAAVPLVELQKGERGVLEELHLPDEIRRRLMELGFLPGEQVTVGHSAPGGDPCVFRVDGTEVALRRETAMRIMVRPVAPTGAS